VLNTMAPTVFDVSTITELAVKPPVLWVRGDGDQIVSDTSAFDLAFLGSIGAVPRWPGEAAFGPQPMVRQTRAVLERYAASGGRYREVVLPAVGHSPHVERPPSPPSRCWSTSPARPPSPPASPERAFGTESPGLSVPKAPGRRVSWRAGRRSGCPSRRPGRTPPGRR
jgi:hypothetical protein